jgi:transmembrane protein TMEM260 (protein O-mannosyltransferase)
VKRSTWLTAALISGLFFALHLPFLPSSLEDLDSINFALGIRSYDVSLHQPHPPGYPLFILAAKLLHKMRLSEVHALSLISVLGGALGIFGCLALFRALEREGSHSKAREASGFIQTSDANRTPWLAVVLVATCPLYWMTSARPLSDAAGLAAALALQALIIAAPSVNSLALVAAVAGFALGLRSQIAWLTVPVLVHAFIRHRPAKWWSAGIHVAIAYVVGALIWAIPLLIVSGPTKYIQTFWNQGAEDLTGVAMLATTHTVSLLIHTLQDQLLAPWGYWQTGAVVLGFAMLGVAYLAWRDRWPLMALIACFGPYLVFDLLFQEAITTRYALPLVIPIAYLAVRGASLLGRNFAILATVVIAAASVFIDDAAAYGYARMPAPAFRMLGDMHAAPVDGHPVLAMHRNQDFSMRRPIQWVGDEMPATAAHLPATPKHEWLEAVKYWNAGGRGPLWFVADPRRSDLALFHGQRRPTLYRWPFSFTGLIGGARPDELDWYVFDEPDWYLGEGWALTPETAGVAGEDHRGPGLGGIHGWIRRSEEPIALMIGGRNLSSNGETAHVRVAIEGRELEVLSVTPGFFLQITSGASFIGKGGYAEVTVNSDSQQLAIEQFDAQPAGRVVSGFGEGWNEQEYNPVTGDLWRWTTDRAAIRVRSEGHSVALSLRGEIEAASSSHVTVRAGSTVVAAFDVARSFTRTVLIPSTALPGSEDTIWIETSAWYVPAEKRWRSKDRRRLGLKLFECKVTPAS